jgi:hypothetical protein
MIYLVDQIFILSPMYMHYMYPYERHMVVMKGYVHNHAHPEGSMIEGYTTKSTMWNMRKNTTNMMRCLSLWIKNDKYVEINISYRNVISYACFDGERKLIHCNVDIMSLNHYLMYVTEAINCHYVIFHINVQHIFYYLY